MLEHSERLDGVHERIVRFASFAADRLEERYQLDLLVYEGKRSTARQAELFSYGRTVLNPDTHDMTQVTWTLDSDHIPNADGISGATDFVVRKNKAPVSDAMQAKIADLVHEWNRAHPGEELEAGGDWAAPKKDPPHVQVKGWDRHAAPAVASSSNSTTPSSSSASKTVLGVALCAVALVGGTLAAFFL